jgi:hypothetical protein
MKRIRIFLQVCGSGSGLNPDSMTFVDLDSEAIKLRNFFSFAYLKDSKEYNFLLFIYISKLNKICLLFGCGSGSALDSENGSVSGAALR